MRPIREDQRSQITPVKQEELNKVLLKLVGWSFLIGSLIFQIDAILEFTEGVSIHVILHLLASFLFTLGSVLFVIHEARQA
jgi:hypothetical protein